jgi:hypothetical protein
VPRLEDKSSAASDDARVGERPGLELMIAVER